MDGYQGGAMDGGWDDDSDGSQAVSDERLARMINEVIRNDTRVIDQSFQFENFKEEIRQEIREKFADCVNKAIFKSMLLTAIPHFAAREREQSGWVSDNNMTSRVQDFKYKVDSILSSGILDDWFSNWEQLAGQMKEVLNDSGIVTTEAVMERIEHVKNEMAPIFAMLADPNLALSERVKSFSLD